MCVSVCDRNRQRDGVYSCSSLCSSIQTPQRWIMVARRKTRRMRVALDDVTVAVAVAVAAGDDVRGDLPFLGRLFRLVRDLQFGWLSEQVIFVDTLGLSAVRDNYAVPYSDY